MATTTAKQAADAAKQAASEERVTRKDLEDDVARLREDVARLTEQLSVTGGHSYKAARQAASERAETLRTKGEETMESLKSSADDMERQLTATVREKPITSLAVAAAVGYLFALISSR